MKNLLVLALLANLSSLNAFAETDNQACDAIRKELAIEWTTKELQRLNNTTDVHHYGVNRAYKIHEFFFKRFFTERGIVPVYKVYLQAKARSGRYYTSTCKIYFKPQETSSGCADANRITCMDGDFEFSDRGPYLDRAL